MKQFSKEELRARDVAHAADVKMLIAHGGYAQLRKATQYVENKLSALWRPILGIEDDDESLVDQLGFTPTMTLILHLFGRAVHHHGAARSKLPLICTWTHVMDRDSQRPRFPLAISKNNIAKLIGKSRSAVDEAIQRFRGKQAKYEVLFDKRIAFPMFVETGIVLDIMAHPNLSFPFMLGIDDYTHAGKLAQDASLNDADTNHKQRAWCHESVNALLSTPEFKSEPDNTVDSASAEEGALQ